MLDYLLFGIFPYIAITLFVFGTFYRFYNDKYSMSSQSSQFLGNKTTLVIGSIAFHWGIILILTMHFLGIFTPTFFDKIVTSNNRKYWEWSGWVLATALIIGLIALLGRRVINPRLRTVTTTLDWFIIILILTQAVFGLYIAFWRAYYDPPGGDVVYASSWFVSDIGGWLRSLLAFDPDIGTMTQFPWALKFHFANGLLIIAIFPFTRLMHMLSYPFRYMWRSYQVVIWNREPYTRDWHWDK
ncbi:MAG: Respiratory nitrate reductase 2 gamma chain [Candidatus Heimdallarchaeota archaeon LC_2]|nr:MAG: Respiratory nitrate reductase 2 gamma chain [Candidatus Heimdallarchaeota archaeon LC_2]